MMRCEEMMSLMDLYLEGELSEDLAGQADRHLLRCLACGGEARALEQTRALLASTFDVEAPSPAYLERASARLLNLLSPHLRLAPSSVDTRQWELPFAKRE